MRIVVLGLALTSAWGNGHASTYRSLLRALSRRGHEVLFLERELDWYADNRDLPSPSYARVGIYDSLGELTARFSGDLRSADLVIVGSYVPEGPEVIDLVFRESRGIRAFYDIDTPVTLARLAAGDDTYLRPAQIPAFDVYFSFSGGPVLETLEREHGAQRARALYCSIDPDEHQPVLSSIRWHLGYLGTYSADRAEGLDMRLLEPARRWEAGRFIVAGSQFPKTFRWPGNVDRLDYVPPGEHGEFYSAQRFTLNLTRKAMTEAGYSPSVRLFEAAACGVPVITDPWPGLETFFVPDTEILVTTSTTRTLEYLIDLPDNRRRELAARARARVLAQHTADHRALEVEQCVTECGAPAHAASQGAGHVADSDRSQIHQALGG